MSAVTDLLSECSAAGVKLFLDNGRLRYRAQPGAYTEDLRQRVAVHRDAVIAALAKPGPVDRGVEAPQAGAAATPVHGQAAGVSLSPSTSRDKDVPSTPVKHTRRRSLAGTPPPHIGPLTDGRQGPCSFLYSVIRDGVVERGVFIGQGIRSEPEALLFLRGRYPELRVQWARLIQHPICRGCRYYTASILCSADRSPDYAARVGDCGKYVQAGELEGQGRTGQDLPF
jgi:hypothetical protein